MVSLNKKNIRIRVHFKESEHITIKQKHILLAKQRSQLCAITPKLPSLNLGTLPLILISDCQQIYQNYFVRRARGWLDVFPQ